MTLWIVFGVLLCVALGFLVWPLYRHTGRLTVTLATVIMFAVVLSAGLYHQIGQPGVPSGAGTTPDVNVMVESLETRLQNDPNDVEGWLTLARSFETLEQYDKAAEAYEKVLQLQPKNSTALFYGGYIAAGRGDNELAASRWEALLREGAPEEVRDSIQTQINAWRGIEAADEVTPDGQSIAAIVSASVSMADGIDLAGDPTLFIIARDPEQLSPPIAVARRKFSELPLVVELSDRDAMVPGRNLSAFSQFELLARVSLTGAPTAQPGDWFGSLIFASGNDKNVELVIDQQVPLNNE